MKTFTTLFASLLLLTQLLQAQPETQLIMETNGGEMEKIAFGDLNNDLINDCLMLINDRLVWYTMDASGIWGERYVLENQISKDIKQLYITDIDGDGSNDIGFQYYVSPVYYFGWYHNSGTDALLWEEHTTDVSVPAIAGWLDVDDDGDDDLISATYSSTLSLHINSGGAFLAPVTLAGAVGWYSTSDKADIDLDGYEDLVVRTTDGNLRYLHNNADGTLTIQIITTAYVYKVRLGDINGDGYRDIVYNNDYIFCHRFDPIDGDFHSPTTIGELPYTSFICTDFDGDADVDIAYVEDVLDDDQRVKVFFNSGFGEMEDEVIVLGDLLESATIVLADINMDDRVDVLEFLKKKTDAYLQHGDGTFTDNYEPDTTHNRIVFSEYKDLNGDGTPDLLQVNEEGVIGWLEYDAGTNTIADVHPLPKNEASPSPTGMLAEDIDADGDIDVVAGFRIAPGFEHWSYYFLNDGAGNFTIKQFSTLACAQMTLIDANEDGDLDLIALGTNGYIYQFSNTGDTAALYAGPVTISYSGTNSFATTDVNNDGLIDLVATRNYDDIQKIVNAAAPASFNATVDYIDPTCISPYSVYCEDYDADGDTDILYACSDGLAYAARNDAGTFVNQSIGTMKATTYSNVHTYQLLDLNNDGKGELIYHDRNNGMYIKYSNPAGYASDHVYYPGSFGKFMSIDGDLSPDLVAASDFEWFITYDATAFTASMSLSAPTVNWLAESGAADTLIFQLDVIPAEPLSFTLLPHAWINVGAGTGVAATYTIPADSSALNPIVVTVAHTHADTIPEQVVTGTVECLFDPAEWGLAAPALDTLIQYTLTDDDPALFLSATSVTLVELALYTDITGNFNVYQPATSTLTLDPDDHITTIAGEGITTTVPIGMGINSVAPFTFKLRNTADYVDETDVTEYVHVSLTSILPMLDTMSITPIEALLIDDDVSEILYIYPLMLPYAEGESFTIKFRVMTAPLEDVDIIAQPDAQLDLGEGPGEPVTFHFAGDDYYGGYKSMTGTPVLDGITEGSHQGYITYTIVTDDPLYAAMSLPTTTINIEDAMVSIETEEISDLQITPTAGDGHITINAASTPGMKQVIIYALNGAAVYTLQSAAEVIQLDLSALPAGSYWAVVRTDTGVKSGRFSVTH